MSRPTTYYHEDTACSDCGAPPELRICVACGAFGLVVDCGHEDRPRPLDESLHVLGITCTSCERRLERQAS